MSSETPLSGDRRHRRVLESAPASVSDELIRLVKSVDDRQLTDLPHLVGAIDTDALDQLFEPRQTESFRDPKPTVSFTYAEYHVRIDSTSTPSQTVVLQIEGEANG